MKKLIGILILIALIGGGWYLFGWNNSLPKDGVINNQNSENAGKENGGGEKFTSKMLGWLGVAHGGDPNKPETWDVINGIKVPPMPDEKENNKTIGGIDINNNGVRDDVERAIVLEFGKEPDLLPKVMEHSATQRTAMMTQTKEDAKIHSYYVACFYQVNFSKSREVVKVVMKYHHGLSKRIDLITSMQTNNKERATSYADAMLSVGARKGCNIYPNGEIK